MTLSKFPDLLIYEMESLEEMALKVPCDSLSPCVPNSVSSLWHLGVSLRAVSDEGLAAHRIKYLNCWAKNWVSCSHRAACPKGICRA